MGGPATVTRERLRPAELTKLRQVIHRRNVIIPASRTGKIPKRMTP